MVTNRKQLLFEKQAQIVKAIAHPLRIAVLDFLKDGPQCVCDIAEHVRSERSNVSRHLSVMVAAGALESHKEGLKVIYALKTPCVPTKASAKSSKPSDASKASTCSSGLSAIAPSTM